MENLKIAILLVTSFFGSVGWFLYWDSGKQLQELKGYKKKKEELEQTCKQLKGQIEAQNKQIREIVTDQVRAQFMTWLRNIPVTTYRNEIEVEIKFIRPLVRYLGYREEDIDLRVPMNLQVGTQSIKGEADWVLWDRKTDPTNPSVVIEAKAPNQALDEKVQGQARSYAFGLNAPIYAITNGQRLRIFRRGIQNDARVVDCAVTDLRGSWSAIYQALGKSRNLDSRQLSASDTRKLRSKYVPYTNRTLGISVGVPQGWENIQDADKPESPLFDAPESSMSFGIAIVENPARRKLVDIIDWSHAFDEYEILESRTDIVIQGHKAAMTAARTKGSRGIEQIKNLEVTQLCLAIELNGSALVFTFLGDKLTDLMHLYTDTVATIEFLS